MSLGVVQALCYKLSWQYFWVVFYIKIMTFLLLFKNVLNTVHSEGTVNSKLNFMEEMEKELVFRHDMIQQDKSRPVKNELWAITVSQNYTWFQHYVSVSITAYVIVYALPFHSAVAVSVSCSERIWKNRTRSYLNGWMKTANLRQERTLFFYVS